MPEVTSVVPEVTSVVAAAESVAAAAVVPEVVAAAEAPVAISASGAEFVEVFGGDYDEAPEAFNNATESIYALSTTTTRSTMSEEVKAEIRNWLKPIFVQG